MSPIYYLRLINKKNCSYNDRRIQINIRQLFYQRLSAGLLTPAGPLLAKLIFYNVMGFFKIEKRPIAFQSGDSAL